MAEFKLGRIRFVWKGDWAASTTYVKDDVIKYGGRTYICQVGHTSADNFYTDLDFVPTKWNQMTDGTAWRGDWETDTFYSENDVVKYGGTLYICLESHISASTVTLGLEDDLDLPTQASAKWEVYADGLDWKSDWAPTTRYKINDLVRYGGYTYVCNEGHTSAADYTLGLEDDQDKWDPFNRGIEFTGDWSDLSVRYRINDVVKYGGSLYICVTEHTSAGTFQSQIANWSLFVEGFDYTEDWNAATNYKIGDIVKYGGNQYYSRTNHLVSTEPPADGTNWALFTEGFNYEQDFNPALEYRIGDVVRLNGYTYLNTQDTSIISVTITSSSAVNNRFVTSNTTGMLANMAIAFSGSTFGNISGGDTYFVKAVYSTTEFSVAISPGGAEVSLPTATGSMTGTVYQHPVNTSYWSVLSKGFYWRNTWTEDTYYEPGDVVRYGTNAYVCINKHRAEQDDGSTIRPEGGGHPNSRPDQDVTGTYWNVLSVGTETSVLTTKGDLVYYSDVGPARLPIGQEGQVLRVSDNLIPEWASLGNSDYTYFVSTAGTDEPAPIHGLNFDKPWKTIRYACEQVERGPRNPNAKHLLELNRVFIQREVTEWIIWQIANATPGGIWDGFTYDDYKCERDTGLVVDAVMHDISHGGNVRSRGAALAYVNALLDSPGTYTRLSEEAANDVAAFNYMLSVVEDVLNQEAPSVNYQVLNGDNSTAVVDQYFNPDREAESGVMSQITALVGIINDAITAGNADNIPARYSPNNLIKIATGRYREVLPIIVPEQTCVIGAELRSTNAGPREGTTALDDVKYSVEALGRLEAVVGDIVLGNDVTETTGNTEVQSSVWPFADTAESTDLKALVRMMQHNIDFRTGALAMQSSTDPTNYNSSYLVGYGDARKLVKENKKFLQLEIREWLAVNYPNLKYSKTSCLRDVGYIIDGLVYDLTYGGNAQSVVSGLAYYEGVGSSLYIDSTELTATVAAYQFLKSRLTAVAENTSFTPLNDEVAQFRDTAGSAAAVTLIQDNIDDIIDILQNGPAAVGTTVTLTDPSTSWVAAGLTSAYSTLNSAVATIQTNTIDYINTNFGSFTYDSAKCRRDTGLIIDGAYWDTALNTNYWAVTNGLSYRRAMASEVIDGQLTETLGAIAFTKSEAAESLVSNATAVSRSNASFDETLDIIQNGAASADALTFDDPGVDTNRLYARQQLVTNRAFIQAEIISWINTTYPSLTYDSTLCSRDVGYIVDALCFDIQYGSNIASRTAAQAYFEGAVSVLPTDQKEPTRRAFERLQGIVGDIVLELPVVKTGVYAENQDTSGTAASSTEADDVAGLVQIVIDVIAADSVSGLPAASNPSISWVAAGIQTAVGQLATDRTDIVAATLQYITDNFSSFVYNHSKCSRDVATILKAVGYDFMFDSNFQSIKSGYSYLRETAYEVFSLGQKEVTMAALTYVKDQAVANVGGNATAQTRITSSMQLIDDIIYGASNEGSPCASELRNVDYAVLQLERNRDYIVSEISAWITDTYKDTATATSAAGNVITIADTSWLQRNAAVRFSGTTLGGLMEDTTYYVQNVVSATTFTVATTRFSATPVTLTNDSGSMSVNLYYNTQLCLRDVNEYIDALKYDLKWPGNYRSRLAARYYANAVVGSLEEDMYYLRDATGVRDMTLEGLTGDLTPENEYGTSRVTAGAYCSLDPGWGPDDFRAWIITRSPYVQGVTTIGYAAIGQKIDGALHNGGNDSIVSNDFTQVISDGIGAWVANNGRAELVSVFTYYSHIGYLCTEGGRIRGTNGNNSYGDFGSVAEGFDSTETPNTAVVDNRGQFVAVVDEVWTDGDEMLAFEFSNAGSEYTEATWTLTGGGLGAASYQDEFRDDAVYQVRLLDFGNDSSGQFGGEGYLTNSNTAQGGTSVSITLSATDDELSTAYVGMKVYVTGGAGQGQYGIITSYNSGTKLATVIRESDGLSGWDHVVPGTTIASPDASSTYTVEPRIQFTAPGFNAAQTSVSSSGTWTDVIYGDTAAIYTAQTGTYSGNNYSVEATFDVTRNGSKYFVSINNSGAGYTRLETVTIPGTSLGGTSPTNDLTITLIAVDSLTGSVVEIDTDGFGVGGVFVAVKGTGTDKGSYSKDGFTWEEMTLPSVGDWTAVGHGIINDGSSTERISRFVALRTGSTQAAWSADGQNWNPAVMPTSETWNSVAYGNGRFVAVNSANGNVAVSLDGEVWDITATSSGASTEIIFGRGQFYAIRSGSNVIQSSPDGEDWNDETLSGTRTWSSVAWGRGIFVAVASDSDTGSYSIDGENWSDVNLGSIDGSSVSGYQKIRYGQGLFMVTAYQAGVQDYSWVVTSEDGLNWTAQGLPATPGAMSGYNALAFGNPNRTGYWAVLEYAAGNDAVRVRTGARAKGRAYVAETKIYKINISEPGSGYDETPTMTITDPNNIYEAPFTVRVGKGALATPSFTNRGSQYVTGSAEIDTGNGYADFYQSGGFVAVKWITSRPIPGSNITFGHLPGRDFKLVNVITFLGSNDGAYTAFFQVSPVLEVREAGDHLDSVTTRIRYSQVRLTGHDFLDIGTGSFTETNYPGTPTQDPIPANETVSSNGGRVFFTSTDQDGNFRVGDLFAIEQSTGIATLNADAFNISGLQELNLGNVTLGGASATITEFSTDPFFTADSDNVVPTQRAIKAYISAQIGGGGASLNVNSVTAGSIFISSNVITTTTGVPIIMKANFDFRAGVTGVPLALGYMFK